jgi:hypothetical protein
VTDFIDYDQIQLDFQAAVEGANLGFESVLLDANDRDYLIDKMPLLDIRIKGMAPEGITNATYYTDITLECEVCAYSLVSRREAAKIRSDLTNKLQRFVKDNPRFGGNIETTFIGQGTFGSGESKSEGAFVAGAVLEFHVQLYSE